MLKGVGGLFSGLSGWFMKEKSAEGSYIQRKDFELQILEPPGIGDLGNLHVLHLHSSAHSWDRVLGLAQSTLLTLLPGPLESTLSLPCVWNLESVEAARSAS